MRFKARRTVLSSISPRGRLGLLSGNSLVWNLGPNVVELLGSSAKLLAESPLVEFSVTLFPTTSPVLFALRFLTSLALYTYAFYLLVPRMFPSHRELETLTTNRVFKTIAATVTMAMAVVLTATVPLDLLSRSLTANTRLRVAELPLTVGFAFVVGTALAGFAFYSSRVGRWMKEQGIDGHESSLLTSYISTPERLPLRTGLGEKREAAIAVIGERTAWAMLFTFGSILAAAVTAIVSMLFPLPEVVVLVSALFGAFGTSTPISKRKTGEASTDWNLPHVFYKAVGASTRSEKGFGGIALLLLGGFGAAFNVMIAGVAVIAIGFAAALLVIHRPAIQTLTLEHVVGMWNGMGAASLLIFAGLYSLWFWLVMAQRFPSFLEDWDRERGYHKSDVDQHDEILPPVPLGNLSPIVISYGIIASTNVLHEPGSRHLFTVLWLPILLGGIYTSVRTRDRDPRDPSVDNHHLFLGFALQAIAFSLLVALFPGQKIDSYLRLVVTPLVLGGVIYYLPDVKAFSRLRPSDPFITIGYLIISMVLIGVLAVTVSVWIGAGIPILAFGLGLLLLRARTEAR